MAVKNTKIFLKPDREKSLLKKHPWVFSGAVSKVEGSPGAGDTVDIYSAKGDFLAHSAYSPASQIIARVWSFKAEDVVGEAFFAGRISDAVERRKSIGQGVSEKGACRIVFSESDGLPGLIADRYADTLAVQILTAGCDKWRKTLVDLLVKETGCGTVVDKSDADARKAEGLPPSSGLLYGEQRDAVEITENGLSFNVDLSGGQKTGFYLDQRENRSVLRSFSEGREVLDCFTYTGGFAMNALAGGAESVVAVDSSASAIELVKKNAELNGFQTRNTRWIKADVHQLLRDFAATGKKFDMIILDPPKLASSKEHVAKAERAYKDTNMIAMKLLNRNGVLFTFSCSGAIGPEEFQKITAWARADSGRDAAIIGKLSQAADHPISLGFPQSEYLKGLIIQVYY